MIFSKTYAHKTVDTCKVTRRTSLNKRLLKSINVPRDNRSLSNNDNIHYAKTCYPFLPVHVNSYEVTGLMLFEILHVDQGLLQPGLAHLIFSLC